MELLIENIKLKPGESPEQLKQIISRLYSINTADISHFRIIRKSLDARKKRDIFFRYRVVIGISDELLGEALLQDKDISLYTKKEFPGAVQNLKGFKATIIGTGPAGLFCALRLIEAGAYVEIFERGKPIEERMKDISLLEKNGILDPESNVLFGEGGAGTYSDGKLTTRTNKPEIDWFYKKLLEHGAAPEILYEANPHIGTDKLRSIIKNIRHTIEQSGSKIFFNEKLVDMTLQGNDSKKKIISISTSLKKEYPVSNLVLAIGHSARDTYDMLLDRDIFLEKKGFAVGVRVEHPSELINSIQYGNPPFKEFLPTADYRLTHNNKNSGRGTYSFCMCPGGSVINSSSEPGRLNTNGMSFSQRNSPFSNSAIVVSVKKEDLEDHPLSGIEFQRKIEAAAFSAGGGGFFAPAQRITSFLNNIVDKNLPKSSFSPGLAPVSLDSYLPHWITREIKDALYQFDKRMKGFISGEGLFIGAETRTSSPVRITREKDFQSCAVDGIFPIGEGAGYSGGIVSSAVDGIRAADAIADLI
ncbi:MAG: hypothetical protein GY754_24625 [bacterium]|nr:hypothetical protein [bacterium]